MHISRYLILLILLITLTFIQPIALFASGGGESSQANAPSAVDLDRIDAETSNTDTQSNNIAPDQSTKKTAADESTQEDSTKKNTTDAKNSTAGNNEGIPKPASTTLRYSKESSNTGFLYKFSEEGGLPLNSSYTELSIRSNIPEMQDLPPFKKTISTQSKEYEFNLVPSYNTFYPQIPLVAILTVFSDDNNLIKTSHTKFSTDFSFYQGNPIKETLKISHPIFLDKFFTKSVENNRAYSFSPIYKQSHTAIESIFFEQIDKAIENYSSNPQNKYVLISISALDTQYSLASYARLLDAVNSFKEQLVLARPALEKIDIDTDVHLSFINTSENFKPTFTNDQIILSISDTKSDIAAIKSMHEKDTVAFLKSKNRYLQEEYRKIGLRLETVYDNVEVAKTENAQAILYLQQSNAKSTLLKSRTLSQEMDLWIINIDKITNALSQIQIDIKNSQNNAEAGSKLQELNSRSQTLLGEYFDRTTLVKLYKESNDGLAIFLDVHSKFLDSKSKILSQENNIYLINFSSTVSELKSLYSDITSLLNASNSIGTLELSVLLSAQNKLRTKLEILEEKIFQISEFKTIDNLTLTEENLIPIDSNKPLTFNINNGVTNLILLSETLRDRNTLSEDLRNTNKHTDKLFEEYMRIEKSSRAIMYQEPNQDITSIVPPLSLQEINPKYYKSPSLIPSYADANIDGENTYYNVPPNYANTQRYDDTNTIANSSQFRESNAQSGFETYQDNPITPAAGILSAPVDTNTNSNTSSTAATNDLGVIIPTIQTAQANGSREAEYAQDYTILTQPSLSQDKIVRYISSRQSSPVSNVRKLVRLYYKESSPEGVNPEIAIAQMLYTTNMVSASNLFRSYNPAAIGNASKTWKLYPFPNLETGVRAHIQHLKAYSSSEVPRNPIVDPRYKIVSSKGYNASISNLYEIGDKWYGNPETTKKVIAILDDMRNFN